MKRLLLTLALPLVLALAVFAPRAQAQGTVRVAIGTSMNQLDPALTTIGDEYVYVHLVV